MSNYRNPFSPGRILIDSARYAGRGDLIIETLGYLQNQRSIFITGERGVGKSSFAMQLKNLLNKDPAAFERFNISRKDILTNAIIVNYRCTGEESLQDLITNLSYGLSKRLDDTLAKTEKTTTTWKLDLKFISHENHLEESFPTPSVTKEFSELIIDCFENNRALYNYGICFMIDEIDILINKIDLGVFIKVFLENLSDVGIQNVIFILVGISKGLNALKLQHPSITRYLMPIYVSPMIVDELDEIVDRALAKSEVEFDSKIRKAIYMLSQGFPDPVHLIGYELFEYAIKNNFVVDFKILEEALRKITMSIKKEEFLTIRNKIPNVDCERLLLEMAKDNDETVNIFSLSKKLETPEEECNEMCIELSKISFLEREGLGVFKFRDPLFKVYLNMINIDKEVKAEHARMFMELNNAAKQLGNTSISDVEQKRKEEEEQKHKEWIATLYDIILRNYKETGKTGFWG